MNVLNSSNQICVELKKMKPDRIAVAYIGKDYDKFIDPTYLNSIIIAPTIGSNPEAIGDLVNRLGWNKVFFLDNLHAKIYLAKNKAILTSANLSKNALEIGNLVEVGILLDSAENYKELEIIYKNILSDAQKQYIDENSKKERLVELHRIHRIAIVAGIFEGLKKSKVPTFINYIPEKHGTFKVIWYGGETINYNNNTINKCFPGKAVKEVKEDFYDAYEFSEKDDVKQGEWLLSWNISNNKCSKSKISWCYIHKKIPHGTEDDGYPNLFVQLKGKKVPKPPFNLDKYFKEAFCKVIELPEFAIFRPNKNDDELWYVKKTLNYFDNLIKALRKEYKNLTI